jgi:tRNA 2-thiouridine synthesizing protein A
LTELKSGKVLRILATDPGSVKDFEAFARQTGNQLLSHAEADKIFTFFMKKK